MKRINWDIFFDNSSTEEAISLFALGKLSFFEFALSCWPHDCKQAIKSLRTRGYKKARRAAQRALLTRGFTSYKEDYEDF